MPSASAAGTLTPGWTQSGTCEWNIDSDGTLTIRPLGNGESGTLENWEESPWRGDGPYGANEKIKKVAVDGSVKAVTMYHAFYGCTNLTDISGLVNLDVSEVENMGATFCYDSHIESFDSLKQWDVSRVENMGSLFYESHPNIEALSSWNTSNVVTMGSMFTGSRLASNDLKAIAGWDVSHVSNMSYMFQGNHEGFTNVDALSGWNTSSLEDMKGIFQGCTFLQNVDGLAKWNTSKVTGMREMFRFCSALENVDGMADWDVSSLEEIYVMFVGCESLTNLNGLSKWNTSSLKRALTVFEGLNIADVSPLANWDMSKVEEIGGMFSNCMSLSDITPLANWNLSSVKEPVVYPSLTSDYDGNLFRNCPISKFSFGDGWPVSTRLGIWTPTGGNYTGKWISKDAEVKGPFTTEELLGNWDYPTMKGVWIAQTTDDLKNEDDDTEDDDKPTLSTDGEDEDDADGNDGTKIKPGSGEPIAGATTVDRQNVATTSSGTKTTNVAGSSGTNLVKTGDASLVALLASIILATMTALIVDIVRRRVPRKRP